MTLLDRREAKLNEIEALLDSKEWNQERHAVLAGELAKLDAQIDARAKHDAAVQAAEAGSTKESFRARPGTENTGNAGAAVTPDPVKTNRAFEMALRKGLVAVQNDAELRTYAPLTAGTDAGGQFLVPVTTGPEIEKIMKSSGAILGALKDFSSTTGETINWPTADDTAQGGEFISENGAVSQANPVFGHVPINAFQWSSKQVLVPLSLLNDSLFDIQGYLTQAFAERAARGFSTRCITDATDGLINISGTGTQTSAAPTVVGWTEPLTLQGQIDLAYDANASYVFNKSTYLAIRALVSTTGQQLWQPQEYQNGLLHGKPFVLCQDMPSIAAGAKYMIYGDLKRVIFRKVNQMSVFRFNELFMNNLQQGFQAYQRIAFKTLVPQALAVLTSHA
jgi:HK97 family phage major capsid protein